MKAGLDIGCSLTKLVLQNDNGEISCRVLPASGLDGMETAAAQLKHLGVTEVCVTGVGAEPFAAATENEFASVTMPPGNALQREVVTQADGVHELLANQGTPLDEFFLVSIGSAVSFGLYRDGEFRQFMPGLSIGGAFIERMLDSFVTGDDATDRRCFSRVPPNDFNWQASQGKDSDLLMKHVFADLKFPQSEFVVASFGRLGKDVPRTAANMCYGYVKMLATLIAGHLMGIAQNADWQWNGKVVFIGTPVNEIETLRSLLQMFCLGLKMDAIFVADGQHACSLGALRCLNNGTAVLPPAGWWKRLKKAVSRRFERYAAVWGQLRRARRD